MNRQTIRQCIGAVAIFALLGACAMLTPTPIPLGAQQALPTGEAAMTIWTESTPENLAPNWAPYPLDEETLRIIQYRSPGGDPDLLLRLQTYELREIRMQLTLANQQAQRQAAALERIAVAVEAMAPGIDRTGQWFGHLIDQQSPQP